MEDRILDDLESGLGKFVWLSVIAGTAASPVVIASHLLSGSTVLSALLTWGAMALVPAVPLLIALGVIGVRRALPRNPLPARDPDRPDMMGRQTQLSCQRR